MAATASIELIKQGPFEGGTRRWSNRYHFDGGNPGGDAEWSTLAGEVVAAEKAVYPLDFHIVQVNGYNAGSDLVVWSETIDVAGTFAPAVGDLHVPLWLCAVLRYSTDQRTSKNKPVYLFSYIHGVLLGPSASWESLAPDQKAVIEAYGTVWLAGFSDGTAVHKRAGPNGAVGLVRLVHPFLGHRDFPA